MKQGSLILASARRVLNVMVGDKLCAIQQVLGCAAIKHGTTLQTEDQLLINGDERSGAPIDRFWVAGVPFPFAGNAVLVGIDPATGNIGDHPAMAIDEFRRLVMFSRSSDRRRFASAPRGALPVTIREHAEHAGEQTYARCAAGRGSFGLKVVSCPVVPNDIKFDIASVVRTFEFGGMDWGTCLARAAVGNTTLIECGLTPRLVAGGMLYRVGPHRRRDTIRFCLPDNRGGYLAPMDSASYLIGHVWNETEWGNRGFLGW